MKETQNSLKQAQASFRNRVPQFSDGLIFHGAKVWTFLFPKISKHFGAHPQKSLRLSWIASLKQHFYPFLISPRFLEQVHVFFFRGTTPFSWLLLTQVAANKAREAAKKSRGEMLFLEKVCRGPARSWSVLEPRMTSEMGSKIVDRNSVASGELT